MTQENLQALLREKDEDVRRFIAAGLPGCFAIGYVPSGIPGKIRRADPNHLLLIDTLLKFLPEVPVH